MIEQNKEKLRSKKLYDDRNRIDTPIHINNNNIHIDFIEYP